jgi:heptaprenyl diphosphate synthase
VKPVPEAGRRGDPDTLALYAALALFFSIVELLIPKPIPFFRIGLANLPLLVALTFLSRKDFVLLVLLKIMGQALVGGRFFPTFFYFPPPEA